jgi:predicted metal-dependent phosphoesterase TrpH
MQRSRIDLHIHSTASDGLLSPSAVVHAALELGLSAIALTDHDTLSGIAEARAAAAGTNLEYIPGVEVNSEGAWGDLHLLGYYLDPADPLLNRLLEAMRDARLGRARKMIDKLAQMGMPVDWEEVEELAAGETVGRPHVARALLNRGHVASLQEAFDRYIANDGPAYAPRLRLTPDEVINAIHAAGGVAVLAHPAQSGATDLIPELVSFGLQGLEVYHPGHSERDVRELLAICRRYGLIATGGTDFHAPDHAEGAPIGSLFVPPECVEKLKAVARA